MRVIKTNTFLNSKKRWIIRISREIDSWLLHLFFVCAKYLDYSILWQLNFAQVPVLQRLFCKYCRNNCCFMISWVILSFQLFSKEFLFFSPWSHYHSASFRTSKVWSSRAYSYMINYIIQFIFNREDCLCYMNFLKKNEIF